MNGDVNTINSNIASTARVSLWQPKLDIASLIWYPSSSIGGSNPVLPWLQFYARAFCNTVQDNWSTITFNCTSAPRWLIAITAQQHLGDHKPLRGPVLNSKSVSQLTNRFLTNALDHHFHRLLVASKRILQQHHPGWSIHFTEAYQSYL